MIADIMRLCALYVIVRVFIEIALPKSKIIVQYLFWAGIVLTAVSIFLPPVSRLLNDIHNVSTAYVKAAEGIEKVSNTVTSLPTLTENIPIVGSSEVTKLPPAKTLSEKINLFGANKKFFDWPVGGQLTQGFEDGKHHGLDIACNEGTPIKVSREGEVLLTVTNHEIYGNYVVIDHGGQWHTLYAHLKQISVKQGQHVWAGNPLGLSGNTGRSTGPHLHFEIRVGGKCVDPQPWMK